MGAFAHVLGIRPWEWDLLSVREVESLITYLKKMQEASDG